MNKERFMRKKNPERNFVRKKSKNELIREKAGLVKSMKVRENSVDEGNTELGNLTKSKILTRDRLIASQTKISMGLKRKAEFSAKIETINK